MMVRAGRRHEFRGMSLAGLGLGAHLPTGRLLDVVAPFAQAESVVGGRGATAVVRVGMVAMTDGGVAIGRSAVLISESDEIGEPLGKIRDRDSSATSAPLEGFA